MIRRYSFSLHIDACLRLFYFIFAMLPARAMLLLAAAFMLLFCRCRFRALCAIALF